MTVEEASSLPRGKRSLKLALSLTEGFSFSSPWKYGKVVCGLLLLISHPLASKRSCQKKNVFTFHFPCFNFNFWASLQVLFYNVTLQFTCSLVEEATETLFFAFILLLKAFPSFAHLSSILYQDVFHFWLRRLKMIYEVLKVFM